MVPLNPSESLSIRSKRRERIEIRPFDQGGYGGRFRIDDNKGVDDVCWGWSCMVFLDGYQEMRVSRMDGDESESKVRILCI
jgi:hypothetical protein